MGSQLGYSLGEVYVYWAAFEDFLKTARRDVQRGDELCDLLRKGLDRWAEIEERLKHGGASVE